MEYPTTKQAIVLFDGECNLCSGAVTFIIPRDPRSNIQFAALQSQAGQFLLQQYQLDDGELNTIILIEGGRAFARSTAALRITRKLSGLWPVLYLLIAVPRPARDLLYRWVAGNRYKWFGRKEQCMIPSPQIKNRFI